MNINNHVEVVTSIFTIIDGKVKVLLFKKKEDPFKGYWMLPNDKLGVEQTVEMCAKASVFEYSGLKKIHLKQSDVFSEPERIQNNRTIACSMMCLVDYDVVMYSREEREIESHWFDINEIPKMIYDHKEIVENAVEKLRKLVPDNFDILRIFYSKDFTLPELQTTYEHLLKKQLDRRNFRKKIMKMNILEETNDKDMDTHGRPAKLYYFKEIEGEFNEQ